MIVFEGIDEALAAVRRRQYFLEQIPSLLQKLCDGAADIIRSEYADGETGASAASVSVSNEGEGFLISAASEGILYIEFGAGVSRNPDGRNYVSDVGDLTPKGIVGIGEYGKGQGKNAGWNYWVDGQKHYTIGTRARCAFPKAVDYILQTIRKEITEAWR